MSTCPEPEPCDYWYDCTLDLQDLAHVDDIELIDYPTMRCRLSQGHEGKHELVLDRDEED